MLKTTFTPAEVSVLCEEALHKGFKAMNNVAQGDAASSVNGTSFQPALSRKWASQAYQDRDQSKRPAVILLGSGPDCRRYCGAVRSPGAAPEQEEADGGGRRRCFCY